MALRIETFDNTRGGNTLYKALTHPAAARPARALLEALARHAPVAIFDPGGAAEAFNAIYDLDQIEIAGSYVQQVARIGTPVSGSVGAGCHGTRPLSWRRDICRGIRCRAHPSADPPLSAGWGRNL